MNDEFAKQLIKAVERIAAAQERTAAAYERMADLAALKNINGPAPAATKAKAPKGDVLTVTGRVIECNLITDRSGNPVLTKKQQEMRKLKLDCGNGSKFETTIFGYSSYLPLISKADAEGRDLIVGYTEKIDGTKVYQNIASMELGAGGQTAEVEEDPEESF